MAIYAKPTLNVKVEIYVEGFTDHLTVEVPTKGNSILCGCGYRTPSHDANPIERITITDAVSQVINKAYAYNYESRKITPGKITPGKSPPENRPGKITPGTITTLEKSAMRKSPLDENRPGKSAPRKITPGKSPLPRNKLPLY